MKQDNLAHMVFLQIVEENDPPCTKVDGEVFFPHEGDWFGIKRAKEICAPCPIKAECLQFAYDTDDQHAILASMTPSERRRLKRKAAA